MSLLPEDINGPVERLLSAASRVSGDSALQTVEQLRGDGSNRRFWRLGLADRSIMVIAPEDHQTRSMREAAAVASIGGHLWRQGVPVPEIYGYDQSSGVLLCEDLGSSQLHGVALATDFTDPESLARLRTLYRQALAILAKMQVAGAENFDLDWCWDTPLYDRTLMLERESGYFSQALWQGMLGQEHDPHLAEEFAALATAASEAPTGFFLHRDFQSRNLMVSDGTIRVIDFQGGRLGPLGYDLASLLLDPYAGLPEWFQQELYDYYLQQLAALSPVDQQSFRRWYLVLALQRNLQILGAFAFLSTVRGKPFFKEFIAPALVSLQRLCRECREPELPRLVVVAKKAGELLS